MSRPFRTRTLVAVVGLVAAGCQEYNFNPVGHCLIEPGGEQFTLSSVSTADVLFVIDDSQSMEGEQLRLAAAFGDFVGNLTSTNVARADAGLVPIDFHIAVTTSSIFYNPKPPGTTPTCRSDWAGSGGKLACCVGTTPAKQPRRCTGDAQCAGLTVGAQQITCRQSCVGLQGEGFCCSNGTGGATANTFPPGAAQADVVSCALAGAECGTFATHYSVADACVPGVGEDEFPLPDGQFVGSVNVASGAANPRVLHFDKRLFTSADGKNAQGFTRAQLETFFTQNVLVGTCGSPQEQAFQAGRQAVEKALLGGQKDTYTYSYAAGLSKDSVATTTRAFTVAPGVRAPGAAAAWPSLNSKLVLVFVGDEDDCSSPKDPAAGVVMSGFSGNDACTADGNSPKPAGSKRYTVDSFVDYFTGLGRPVAAAFIASARSQDSSSSCSGDSCFAAICTDPTCTSGTNVCGGQASGIRFVEAARALEARSADVVLGSICDNFGGLLNQVAEIVKPPETLTLPSEPAESRITLLRIASATGETRKICDVALDPALLASIANPTLQDAIATGKDWWFTATAQPGPPVGVSQFVYINSKTGDCRANPGETYSVDYMGVVPAGGCEQLPGDVEVLGGPSVRSLDCAGKLGGRAEDWTCFKPEGLARGTCTCRTGT